MKTVNSPILEITTIVAITIAQVEHSIAIAVVTLTAKVAEFTVSI